MKGAVKRRIEREEDEEITETQYNFLDCLLAWHGPFQCMGGVRGWDDMGQFTDQRRGNLILKLNSNLRGCQNF